MYVFILLRELIKELKKHTQQKYASLLAKTVAEWPWDAGNILQLREWLVDYLGVKDGVGFWGLHSNIQGHPMNKFWEVV